MRPRAPSTPDFRQIARPFPRGMNVGQMPEVPTRANCVPAVYEGEHCAASDALAATFIQGARQLADSGEGRCKSKCRELSGCGFYSYWPPNEHDPASTTGWCKLTRDCKARKQASTARIGSCSAASSPPKPPPPSAQREAQGGCERYCNTQTQQWSTICTWKVCRACNECSTPPIPAMSLPSPLTCHYHHLGES